MAIKLIAFDMDDTFLQNDMTVSPANMAAIRAAHEKGILIVPATGRPLVSVQIHSSHFGFVCPIIAYNGATVRVADEEIFQSRVPIDLAREIIALSVQDDLHVQVYDDDGFYYQQAWAGSILYEAMAGIKGVEHKDILARLTQAPLKLLFVDLMGGIAALSQRMQELYGDKLSIFQSKPYYLEMVNKNSNKALALAAVAEKYGILKEEVMAIGDAKNDLSMIQYAGIGVAVENASDEVKQHADFITRSNQDDGVAYAIEKFAL